MNIEKDTKVLEGVIEILMSANNSLNQDLNLHSYEIQECIKNVNVAIMWLQNEDRLINKKDKKIAAWKY